MATSSSQTPRRRGGSHFSEGATGSAGPQPRRASVQAPSSTGATPPQAVMDTGRISSRSAAATRRAGSHTVARGARGRRSRAPIFAAALLAVLVVGVLVAVFVVPGLSSDEDDATTLEEGTSVTVTIPEGSGASEVALILYEAGIIDDQSEFLAQVRRTEAEQSIQSGAYSFTVGADYSSIISLLTTGPNASTARLVVPEGYTLAQTAAAAEEALGISADDFIAQAKASNYADDYAFLAGAADDSLEGFLFPRTYDFSGQENVTADTVIRAMLDQFSAELSAAGIDLDSAAATLSERFGITVDAYDVLTMASIVEREAVSDDQRGLVASVFYNRLANGMRLQSDATLVYSIGGEVTAADLEVDDPYNTYTRDGLTPTPICSPSLASIEAAVSPDDTDYFYFYITDTSEVFSATYEEHLQAIANDS